ncbi:MAG: nucleotide exchange factor GrpE [Gallionella sp.]|nr:nucleotide exchange factor GrpE [Gallionella sp.]
MTAQTNNLMARIRAALRALAGNAPEDPRNRVASLELDLRQKDDEIAALREEYGRLRQQGERERGSAASAGFDALARRLAPLLSQLATMESMASGERAPRLEDVFKLFDMLEKVLAEDGLMRIGTVGEETAFDSRWHQRIGGAEVDDGDRIRVRFIGYRMGENVLLKAMVSSASGESS